MADWCGCIAAPPRKHSKGRRSHNATRTRGRAASRAQLWTPGWVPVTPVASPTNPADQGVQLAARGPADQVPRAVALWAALAVAVRWRGAAPHLAELHIRERCGQLLMRAVEQIVLQRHQHYVEALLRELLGDRLADACVGRGVGRAARGAVMCAAVCVRRLARRSPAEKPL